MPSPDHKTLITKCVLFDMDGTLIDTTPLVEKHWRSFAAEHGLDAEKILEMSHGRRTIDTLKYWTPHHATPEIADMYERKLTNESEGVSILPGVTSLLAALPHDKYGICTSAKSYMAEARLKQCNMDIPKVLVTADRVEHGKPDPEGYIMTGKILGYGGSDCVVVEDAPAGVEAAKRAGMHSIACVTTHSLEQLKAAGADYIVNDLGDVDVTVLGDGRLEFTISNPL
ncbi:HAD-like domain-containing protein [Umbelopsis sp. PMI_123]|nr:HAD-like domain-containing protein [Umbelopsis sp. PMI_123]